VMDWQASKLLCELHVKEEVYDLKFLHNQTMFAVAQKRHTYIYDNKGVELHCLKKHKDARHIEFLPYHFLLTTIGERGILTYQDISTGDVVAVHKTKQGTPHSFSQNPYNAIIAIGHNNGTVTMWNPNMGEPLVKILCHRGPVNAIEFDMSGRYMVTSGLDGEMKIWDARTYQSLNKYNTKTPVSTISISQTGLIALGINTTVQVWKDALTSKQTEPYMIHHVKGNQINDLKFCPFEDVLGIGHSNGYSSVLIPGSGQPNFDSMEDNPFQTRKQRKEAEVHSVLEKIPADMISLNPNAIGDVNPSSDKAIKLEKENLLIDQKRKERPEKKKLSRNAVRRLANKHKNIIDKKMMEVQKRRTDEKLKEKDNKQASHKREKPELSLSNQYSALDRFSKKRKF